MVTEEEDESFYGNKIKGYRKPLKMRRQYFVGNLKKPQHIPFVKSDNAEMGLTAYDKFTGEPAHRHSVAKEYAYVISGRTQYMDLDTREI